MPGEIAMAVAMAAFEAGAAAAVSVALYAATYVATAVVISYAASALMGALAKKPKTPDFSTQAADRAITARQPIAPWRVAYGRARLGGIYIFLHTTGSGNEFLHIVIALAGHRVKSIGAMYFDGEAATDAAGTPVAAYAGYVTVVKRLGEADQAVVSELVSAAPDKWTADHRLRGRAYAYVRLEYDQDVFPAGLPNITFDVEGKDDISDPRDDSVGYSENAALCIADYLADATFGLGAAGDIDDDDLIEAANICDEAVDLADETTEPRYALSGAFEVSEKPSTILANMLTSCLGLAVYSGGKWRIRVAAYRVPTLTLTESDLRGPVSITSRMSMKDNYNGVKGVFVSPDNSWQPSDFPAVRSGTYEVEDGGPAEAFTADAGADTLTATSELATGTALAVTSTGTLPAGLDDETIYYAIAEGGGVYKVAASRADAEAATAVAIGDAGTGTHTIRFGRTVWHDIDLAWTVSPATAQRLAKIDLERTRRQMTVTLTCGLTAWRLTPGDTVMLTLERYGWSAKVFEVREASFATASESGNPTLAVGLVLRETDANVYAWTTADEQAMPAAPRTTLPSPFNVAAPSSLALASGTAVLGVRLDGTVFSRIKATWTAPASAFVTAGGAIESEFKKSAAATWQPGQTVRGDQTALYILDVDDGVAYDVRVRSRNVAGVPSAWVTAAGHTVVGKTAMPSDVASLSAQQNGNVVTFRWPAIGDADRTGYELRYKAAPFAWDDAIVLSRETKGTLVTNAGLPPGAWTVGIKAIDTSGNYSATAATAAITVTNTNDIVVSAAQAPRWTGTLTHMIRHDVSNSLVPDSQSLAADLSDAELWDQAVFDPYATATYEAPEIDLGFDANGVRLYADLAAVLAAGEAGAADPILEVDSRDEAGAYGGFEEWNVGTRDFRRLKARVKVDTASGVAAVTGFTPIADVAERTEAAENVTVAPGGTAIVFAERFHGTPNIQVTPRGSSALYPVVSAASATGFTPNVYNAGGADVGGAVDWQATGA